ncbi:SMI1/KNR4 family protein [Actinoplanes sp. NPDC023936]|uniref:SMI1/KNR4 family protein n=1 Tax=Actinoplanes sp. NPDC023936 TaxID=3154910 RepID=UPI0033C7C154
MTGRVGAAWERIEDGLRRVLPDSVRHLEGPAADAAIDIAEDELGLTLPADFRASLRIHNGTSWRMPHPLPMDHLYSAEEIVEATRMWRDNADDDPDYHDPGRLAYLIDRGMLRIGGPVHHLMGADGRIVVATMNGDVWWLLDLDPAPGGTPGQVIRVDIECAEWDVLAPSWEELLLRYARDLENGLEIDPHVGPACEWGEGSGSERPAWLAGVEAVDPYA